MSSKLATIQEAYELILPDVELSTFVQAFDFLAKEEPDSKVTAFHGFSTFKGIKIESSGFDVEGTLKGTVKSCSFVRLYQVYELPSSESWGVWALKFKKDKTQSELKQTFSDEEPQDFSVDMKFSAKANVLGGVSLLRIGFETIKLKLAGVEKSFRVVNPASGSGRDEHGNEIPVDFEEIK